MINLNFANFSNRKKLENVLDFLPYPFIIAKTVKNIHINTYLNQSFLTEIGYTLDDIPTKESWFLKAYPNETYRNQVINNWLSQENDILINGFAKAKALVVCKNGSARWYEIKASIVNNLHVVAFVDINNEVLLQEELIKQNNNNNRMLSVLGHDLRMPIANLNSISSLATNNDISKEEFVLMTEMINRESKQVLDMLETTFNWTKLNFNAIQLNPVLINHQNLIENVVDIYSTISRNKNISVSINLQNFESKKLDEEIITIIIRNLFSNALKFTPNGGKIFVYSEKNNLVIEDFGIGMTTEKIESIINNSYTTTRGTNNELGIGMGLQLIMRLAEKINCKISFESKINVGTKAIISF